MDQRDRQSSDAAHDHLLARIGRWAAMAARQLVTGFGYLERVPVIGGLFTLAGNVVDAIGSLSGAIVGTIASIFAFRTSEAEAPAQQPTTVVADASPRGAVNGNGASHADSTTNGAAALAGGIVAGACAVKSRVGVLNSLGTVVTAADGIYRTMYEDTPWHKIQRGLQAGAETALVLGTDLAIKGASGTGIAAGGGAATAGASVLPLAVVAGAAYDLWGIHQCIETGIDTSRLYEVIDNAIKADVDRLTTLKLMASRNYYLTTDSPHLRDAVRNEYGIVDLTKSENIEKLRAAIVDTLNTVQQDIDNTSWFARWRYLHFTDGQSDAHAHYEARKLDLSTCTAALEELSALEVQLWKAKEAKDGAAAGARSIHAFNLHAPQDLPMNTGTPPVRRS